jgi:hypothetical protein
MFHKCIFEPYFLIFAGIKKRVPFKVLYAVIEILIFYRRKIINTRNIYKDCGMKMLKIMKKLHLVITSLKNLKYIN